MLSVELTAKHLPPYYSLLTSAADSLDTPIVLKYLSINIALRFALRRAELKGDIFTLKVAELMQSLHECLRRRRHLGSQETDAGDFLRLLRLNRNAQR